MKNEFYFHVTLFSGVLTVTLWEFRLKALDWTLLEKFCRKWHYVKCTIQSSVKWLNTGNKAASYKSLYLLNGKRQIKKCLGNNFKYNKLYIYQLFEAKLEFEEIFQKQLSVFPFNKLLFFYLLHYSSNIFKYKKSHFTPGIQLLRLNVTQLSSLYSWTSTKCFPQDCYKNAEKNSLSFDIKSAKATLRPTFVMKKQCTSTSIWLICLGLFSGSRYESWQTPLSMM